MGVPRGGRRRQVIPEFTLRWRAAEEVSLRVTLVQAEGTSRGLRGFSQIF